MFTMRRKLAVTLSGFWFACYASLVHALPTDITKTYTVALVDKFYPGDQAFRTSEERSIDAALYGMLDLDSDREKEPLYHGDFVRMILAHPLIEIVPYEVTQGEPALKGLLRNLQALRRDLFWGESIDAVVLPWESSTLISAFDEGGISINHVPDYLRTLQEWAQTSDVWQTTFEIILVLEDIVELGGQVFTISGNGGPRMINTYSFAQGVITVGASEKELGHYISDNSLVDEYEQAYYQAIRVDDALGNTIGYDVSGNGCSDIALAELTSGNVHELPKRYWKGLKGSSFAAPMAAKKALVGEVGAEFCYNPSLTLK